MLMRRRTFGRYESGHLCGLMLVVATTFSLCDGI